MSALLVGWLLIAPYIQDQAASQPAPSAKKLESYVSLQSEYEAADGKWKQTYDASDTSDGNKPEVTFRYGEWPAWSFAPRFLAIAEAGPKSDDALEALLWIGRIGNAVSPCDRDLYAIHSKAMDLIAEHHLDNPKLKAKITDVTHPRPTPAWERLFRKLVTEAKDRETRGIASLALGRMLGEKLVIRNDPWFEKPAKTAFESYIRRRMVPEVLKYMIEIDATATRQEAVKLLTTVKTEYGGVSYRGTTLGEFAASALKEVPADDSPKAAK